MEQHPVPQNVTTFQFKLIGDITLKQFAYAAGGIILAYVLYKMTFVPVILRYPFAIFSLILGFGLAFVPIEQRPMDRWLITFVKSIYMPTQFVWKKDAQLPEALSNLPVMQTIPVAQVTQAATGIPPSTNQQKQNQNTNEPPVARAPTPPTTSPAIPTQPTSAPQQFKPTSPAPLSPQPIPITRVAAIPAPTNVNQVINSQEITTNQTPKTQPPNNVQIMQQKAQQEKIEQERLLQLQTQLNQLLAEKDLMSKELSMLKKTMNEQKSPPTNVNSYNATGQTTTTVKIVQPATSVQNGIPQLTSYPNIITGIVKNSSANLLPNIIITVKDKEGMPVRALKTNKIGQFAASTQLSNGTYIIELEDPKQAFAFTPIEVVLSGQVLPPLEISAVSEKDIMRQKLAQEIFGKKTV